MKDGVHFQILNSRELEIDLKKLSNGLKRGQVQGIFKDALKPIADSSKSLARESETGRSAGRTKRGKELSRFTKSGRLKTRLRNKLGRDLARGIVRRRYSAKKYGTGASVSINRKKLRKRGRAFGAENVPLAAFLPKGTKERRTRGGQSTGSIKGSRPLWRSFKRYRGASQRTAIKGVDAQVKKEVSRLRTLQYR